MTEREPSLRGSESELRSGILVTPTIRLERLLGSGGMGSVWIAQHLALRAHVVVKFIAREYASNPEARLRFEREATLAAQAKSPHVVQIFDHGTSLFGLPYIAMELLEGQDLGKRIEREGGRIQPLVFANWLTQACRGLARAHAKGITHRDIKPENIFLCDDDGHILVKVLDFGIAKHEGGATNFSGTQTGAMLGTAYYMSPEQTLGQKDVDARADLWALGVVAYYALTGKRPFDGSTLGAVAIAITSAPLVPPSAHDARRGPGIDAWMAKALARSREQRFQSAKAMADAFEQALTESSLGATDRDAGWDPQPAAATLASNAPPPLRAPSTMSPSTKSAGGAASAVITPNAKPRHAALGAVLAGLAALSAIAIVTLRQSPPLPQTTAGSVSLLPATPSEAPSHALVAPLPSGNVGPSISATAELAPLPPSSQAISRRPPTPQPAAAPQPGLAAAVHPTPPTKSPVAAASTPSNPTAGKSPLNMQIQ